jgi:hypothetical protein
MATPSPRCSVERVVNRRKIGGNDPSLQRYAVARGALPSSNQDLIVINVYD